MNGTQHNSIVSFIWGIADDVLRDKYKRVDYRKAILPMTVIRRIDALLEPTKEAVLSTKTQLDAAKIINQEGALQAASGLNFYNTSPFTLRKLLDNPKQLQANLVNYLEGFSPNIQEIIDKFNFHNEVRLLAQGNVLFQFVEKFLDNRINLSPNPILNQDDSVKLPGLTNHGMGSVFEELLRRFNDENNEEAGEHFTPRDVIHLMTNLIFLPVKDEIRDTSYWVYDCACGTGGMLTEADEKLSQLASEHQKRVQIRLHGQESTAETYAICKADLLIKGEDERNIAYGSTLSEDAFPRQKFDFMLANPPYGKSWKSDLDLLCGGNKKEITDPRFIARHDGEVLNLVTRSSDGQLMFLVNMLSKMNHDTPLGSRITTVHNGSALFTGDAGQGESNIRRWILENDWLEAIIGLPENMFYNTGIATYIWVLTNRKPEHRRGKVQLIDATQWFTKLRKNLGKKNCQFSPAQIQQIVETLLSFEETKNSKIFDNEDFGYWQITVERPLRLRTKFTAQNLATLREACVIAKEEPWANFIEKVFEKFSDAPLDDYNEIWLAVRQAAYDVGIKISSKREKLFRATCCERNEEAARVVAKEENLFGDALSESERFYGLFMPDGKHPNVSVGVRYEPDPELRDYENVPLKDDIEAYFRREVLPHVPDAWIDREKTVKGYEISLTKYFYQYTPPRDLDKIAADLIELEKETEGLLKQIVATA